MSRVKKMGLVDPVLLDELKKIRDSNEVRPTQGSNYQNSTLAISNAPTSNPFNTFNNGVFKKRVYGLKKFLTSLLNGRTKKLKYSRLSQYNDALSTLLRLFKFRGNVEYSGVDASNKISPITEARKIGREGTMSGGGDEEKEDEESEEEEDEGSSSGRTSEEEDMETEGGDKYDERGSDDEDGGYPELKQPISSLSLSAARRVRGLMRWIKTSKNGRITWNDKGTTFVNGIPIKGSNIIDLAREVTIIRQVNSSRRSQYSIPPPGWKQFARALKGYNIPRTIVQNKQRIVDIFESPSATPGKLRNTKFFTPRSRKPEKRINSFSPTGITPRRKLQNFGALGNFLARDFTK